MNGKRIGVQAFFAIMRILQLTGLQLSGVYCIYTYAPAKINNYILLSIQMKGLAINL